MRNPGVEEVYLIGDIKTMTSTPPKNNKFDNAFSPLQKMPETKKENNENNK